MYNGHKKGRKRKKSIRIKENKNDGNVDKKRTD